MALSQALTLRFDHGIGQYSVFSNYLCVLGKQVSRLHRLWPPLKRLESLGTIYDSDELLRHSRVAFCDQVARAFADMGRSAGLPTRVVPLDGHVVAEAHYDGSWHMFDPDYAVVARRSQVLGVAELAADTETARTAYRSNRHLTDGTAVVEMLAGVNGKDIEGWDPRAGISRRAQRVARILKWMVPTVALACRGIASE